MTCAKTQGFLAKHKVGVTAQADAKKAAIKGDAALRVLEGVDDLYVAKGKKVVHVDVKSAKPARAELLAPAPRTHGKPARAHAARGAHARRGLRRGDLREAPDRLTSGGHELSARAHRHERRLAVR